MNAAISPGKKQTVFRVRVLFPFKNKQTDRGASPFLIKTKTSVCLRKSPRTPQAALTWRSAMFRAPFPGWGRFAGGTCALIASAFSSPPAHAAENDGRPPNPPLAGASSTTRTMVCACRSRPLAVILHACCRLRRRCPASGGRTPSPPGRCRGAADRPVLVGTRPVVNETVVCPPPCFFGRPPHSHATRCSSHCQKMHGPQGFGLGKGEAFAAGAKLHEAHQVAGEQDRSGGHPESATFRLLALPALVCMRPTTPSQLSV